MRNSIVLLGLITALALAVFNGMAVALIPLMR